MGVLPPGAALSARKLLATDGQLRRPLWMDERGPGHDDPSPRRVQATRARRLEPGLGVRAKSDPPAGDAEKLLDKLTDFRLSVIASEAGYPSANGLPASGGNIRVTGA
jgi:hypothetical protein